MTDTQEFRAQGGALAADHGGAFDQQTVGLIIPDLNHFYCTFAMVMTEGCFLERLQVVVAVSNDDSVNESRQVAALIRAGVAGVVVTPSAAPMREAFEALRTLPVVQVGRDHVDLEADYVGLDEISGMRTAVGHLISLGHRRIAFVGPATSGSVSADRFDGFRQALCEAGIAVGEALLVRRPNRSSFGREAVAALLEMDQGPTALVIASSRLTVGALDALRAAAIEPPNRISLVAYGDPDWYRLWGPGLTTVNLPAREIAATTTSMLLQRIRERATVKAGSFVPQRVPFAPHLIVRGTTGLCDDRAKPSSRAPSRRRHGNRA